MIVSPPRIQEINPIQGSNRYIGPVGLVMEHSYKSSRTAYMCKRRQQMWKVRLTEEAKNWKYIALLTLTYDDNLFQASGQPILGYMYIRTKGYRHSGGEVLSWTPFDPDLNWKEDSMHLVRPIMSLNRRSFVNYVKKVKEQYKRDTGERMKCCYFLCGEYGPSTFRPHAHLSIFFNDPQIVDYFTNGWELGEVDNSHDHHHDDFDNGLAKCGYMDAQALSGKIANYVSKYVAKSFDFDHPLLDVFELEKPFANMSKGIGKSWLFSQDAKKIVTDVKKCIDFSYKDFTFVNAFIDSYPTELFNYKALQLRNILKINYIDYDKHTVFSYNLPRYYRDWLFKRRVDLSVRKARIKRAEARGDISRDERRRVLSFCQVGSKAPHDVALFLENPRRSFDRTFLSNAIEIIFSESFRRRHYEKLEKSKASLRQTLHRFTQGFWPVYCGLSEDAYLDKMALAYNGYADTTYLNNRERDSLDSSDNFLSNSRY